MATLSRVVIIGTFVGIIVSVVLAVVLNVRRRSED